MELSEFDLKYESRGPMKAQFLADFLIELPPMTEKNDWWSLNVDGSSNKKGGGAGVILEGPDELTVEQAIRFGVETSNNQAEYEALIAGLKLARELGVKQLRCQSDSQLVTRQINDEFQTKEPLLQKYYHIARSLIDKFEKFTITHVLRTANERANILSKLAST